MDTTTRIRQIYIPLRADAYAALTAAAESELRRGKEQAVRYIIDGLRRDGYLPPPEPVKAPSR